MVLIGLYFLRCTKFDQLILRKIIKIVATRCQILTLKCTKIDFGLGWEVGRGKGGEGGKREGGGGKDWEGGVGWSPPHFVKS